MKARLGAELIILDAEGRCKYLRKGFRSFVALLAVYMKSKRLTVHLCSTVMRFAYIQKHSEYWNHWILWKATTET